MNIPMTTTYSMWRLFKNCRKACEWRYLHELEPLEKPHAQRFGTLIHECLEIWHRDRQLTFVLDHIDNSYPNRSQNENKKRDWHLSRAMMKGYATAYAQEDFTVVSLEKTFEGKIINPATGASSRSFTLGGRTDGIVQRGNQYFVLENKTASQIDAAYLERLWTDFQVILYSWYIEQTLGIRVSGIIYNILVKARLKQSQGETEAEYEARRQELIAKSKTGKTSAKRKMPEIDEAFQSRLATKYAEPGMFHRETLFVSRDQYITLQSELWELTKSFLDARRRGVFYQNTSFCFHYGRPCAYFPLCNSNGNPNVIENLYQKRTPNSELIDDASSEEKSF